MESEQNNATQGSSEGKAEKPKLKERVFHEAKDIFSMVLYLAISLSLVATFRSLVLIQKGINDFAHGYVVAIVFALALGKIVALAQKLPIVHALNQKPLFWSVLYKSAVMTILADIGAHLEERLFPGMSHSSADATHPLALFFAHQCSLMFIFSVLFTWRDLDRVLGHGTLVKLFFQKREPDSSTQK